MTDFIIVIATAAALASPASGAAAPPLPTDPPGLGFRLYASLEACEQASAAAVVPARARLVCLPVERRAGELASTH
jgi:hypothetical protein